MVSPVEQADGVPGTVLCVCRHHVDSLPEATGRYDFILCYGMDVVCPLKACTGSLVPRVTMLRGGDGGVHLVQWSRCNLECLHLILKYLV